jgi:nucleotide-binding universal stress UspA family protein
MTTSESKEEPREGVVELTPHAPGQILHILVCLDGSALGERVLPHAVALARSLDARVTLLRVLEAEKQSTTHEPVDPLDWEMQRSEANRYLAHIRDRVASQGVRVAQTLAEGHAAEQILGLVAAGGIDLVALSTHGEKGLEDWALSGTAEKVLSQAGTSILLVPAFGRARAGDEEPHYRRILVPLDCSPRAECVFGSLMRIAGAQQSELLLAHALPPTALTYSSAPSPLDRELARSLSARNERVAEEYLERTKLGIERENVTARSLLETGRDVRESLEELVVKEKADLVAMTAHGTTGSPHRHYGAVARDLISRARVPLLIIQDLPVRPRHRQATPPPRARRREQDTSQLLTQDTVRERLN